MAPRLVEGAKLVEEEGAYGLGCCRACLLQNILLTRTGLTVAFVWSQSLRHPLGLCVEEGL